MEENQNPSIDQNATRITVTVEDVQYPKPEETGEFEEMKKMMKEIFESLEPDEKEKIVNVTSTYPKGWLSIDDYLPICTLKDYAYDGFKNIKVRNESNEEFDTKLTDHNTWYHVMKSKNVTHWYND